MDSRSAGLVSGSVGLLCSIVSVVLIRDGQMPYLLMTVMGVSVLVTGYFLLRTMYRGD